MTRRRIYAAIVIVAVVAGASAFGATRVWSESAAHGRYVVAQVAAHAALKQARQAGLTATEISPVSEKVAKLDSAPAPQSLPVFGTDRGDFYSRQTTAYVMARHELSATVRRITRQTRSASASDITALKSDIHEAGVLALDVTAPSAVLRAAGGQQFSARTPGQFRAIAARVAEAHSALLARISARHAAVNRVIRQAHASLPALQSTARQSVSAVTPTLSLLGLVNARGQTDQNNFNALLGSITRDTVLSRAALRMLALNDAIAVAHRDVQRLLPAKMIVVSTETQEATAYQAGAQVFSTPVTTGGPELPTDHGVFHIYMKASNFTFHSPWPPSSPYYYLPSFVQYWMPFDGGEGLHDASWRSNFGPGTNLQPTDLGTGHSILGTHGCVNLPTASAAWIWNWAPLGTTVVVI